MDDVRGFVAPASTFDLDKDTLAVEKLLMAEDLLRENTATYVAKCRINIESSM